MSERDASSGSAALTVALVGPTHPFKGGVAAHTTTLAHELSEDGEIDSSLLQLPD